MPKTFHDLSDEDVQLILNHAVDTDDWHVPSVSNVEYITRTEKAVYGRFTSSLHNQYHDEERQFNINSGGVTLWGITYKVDTTGGLRQISKPRHVHKQPEIVAVLIENKLIELPTV